MSNGPRVLHIIDHMGLGGAQRVLEGLISHSKNEEWFFYSLRKCPKISESLSCGNSNSKYDFLSFFEVKRLIKEKNINILHCHLKKSFLIGYLLKRFFFPNIVLIFHEHGKIEDNKYIKFLHFGKKHVDLFIAVSDATQKRLIHYVKIPERQVKTIFNFVDLDRFNPETINKFDRKFERKRFGVNNTDFVLGFAARIVRSKGWHELLCAFTKLQKKNIKLLIAGTGPEKKELLRKIDELHLVNQIKYVGFVDNITRFYCCIDLFVVPSHGEPFGMTVLETQASGIPVLACNVAFLNELIQNMENGILFKKGDAQDLAEKIEFIINHNKLTLDLITSGLNNVKKYSLDEYIKKMNRLYSSLLLFKF